MMGLRVGRGGGKGGRIDGNALFGGRHFAKNVNLRTGDALWNKQ